MEAGVGRPAGDGVTVAVLTPPGRGALAVVGVAGVGAAALVDQLFRPRSARPVAAGAGAVLRVGRWEHESGEEVVVVRHGPARLEVQCHGGAAAPAAVLRSLVARGATAGDWRDWLAADGMAADEIAIRAALAAAGGPRSARILARQLAGGLREDLGRVARLRCEGRHDEADAVVDRLVRAARVGLRLAHPWRVVVTGAVNAGKSSLVNALAGHARCLVSPQPGTTRDVVETRLIVGGWEIDLVDTAGWREEPATPRRRAGSPAEAGPPGEVVPRAGVGPTEQAGIAAAAAARATADLVLVVHDPTVTTTPPPAAGPDELVVVAKADLVTPDPPSRRPPSPAGEVTPGSVPGSLPADTAAVRTSAVTGFGIAELADRIVAALVPEDRDPGVLDGGVPCTAAQLAAVNRLRAAMPSGPAGAAGSAPPGVAGPAGTC